MPVGLPTKRKITKVIIAAGRAILIFARNLSFISTFCVLVAAMVVSEMTERLSPNMAPPTKAPITRARDRFPFWATPTAMGPTAEMVPTDVPVEREMKQLMRKIPAVMY